MALAAVQQALARLYTDRDARERFWEDRAAAGAEWGLTPEEIEQLTTLSRAEVDRFAGGLRAKRRNEVAKLLPRTADTLGPRLRALFAEYADASLPSGPGKHREDAMRFAAWLAEHMATNAPGRQSIVDLASYEAACLTAFTSGRRIQIRFYRTALRELLTGALGSTAVRSQPTIALWLRLPRNGRMRLVLLTFPWPGGCKTCPDVASQAS
jgi:hypothetical protein